MSLKTPSNKMTLTQLLRIKANNYLTIDGKVEYVPDEIDSRIWELESKLSDKMWNERVKKERRMYHEQSN
jgi:hypothetical protein